ncbi:hypothetical protein JQX13_16950 [Archangium violaceum]|uniref:hypothetical protein n=1 Tax=Archangium violaceum TaxID=83451 RepID=UPI00193C1C24|nr:hypothetical protein [Archangium violaceum]QRK11606.1 hypothetical protein JQX13_16950 [Archangium violaceum]
MKLDCLETALSIPRPRVAGAQEDQETVIVDKPQRLADGSWRWLIKFEDPAPLELPGFIVLRTSPAEDGPGTPHAETVLPVTARPLLAAAGPQVDPALFKVDKDGFIVALSGAGKAMWESPKQTLYVISGLLRFKACSDAMDIKVGWGLVRGLAELAAKKFQFELLDISGDGLSCTLKCGQAAKLLEAATAEQKSEGTEKNQVKLTFAPATCDDPKQLALWVFDEKRELVFHDKPAAAKARLGAFAYSKYKAAYRKSQPMRMHVSLASALGVIMGQFPKEPPALERIDADGLGCIINVRARGAADKVRAAAASGVFHVDVADPADKTRLRISATPEMENWLVASFHPGRMFDDLARDSRIDPGVMIYYWFDFIALNGQGVLYPFAGESTGEGDGSITLAKFEELKAKTSNSIQVTYEEPSRYRKVALRDMPSKDAEGKETQRPLAFHLRPKAGQCELEISACVAGAPEDLNKYVARFSRQAPGSSKKWEPIKGFTHLRPDKLEVHDKNTAADWIVSARVPFPQPHGAKKSPLDGENGFKLELVAQSEDHEPKSLEVEDKYDFTPRWVGELTVEPKGELLEIRCHSEGMEVPLPGAKNKGAWNVAREFELVIDPDKADEHLQPIKPKLSEHIRYATPTVDGKRGGCDLDGDFVATLELKALAPGVAYNFTVRRPLEKSKPRPVRLTDVKPLSSSTPFMREE